MLLPGGRSTARSLAVLCVVIAGLGACSDDGDGDEAEGDTSAESSGAPEGEDTSVFDINVGDCLTDDVAGGDVSEAPVVPCEQPHASEVYHSYTIDEESFPGSEGMSTYVDEQCMPAFQQFIGMPYETSAIEVTTLEPTETSWEQGDRELLCLAVDPAGEVTGSLQGANR